MQDSIVEKFNNQELTVFGLVRNETSYDWLVNYVNERNITFDMLYQADEVFAAYGVYQDPTYVLLDRDGQIRFREGDYYSYRISELINYIQLLIEG